MGLFNIFRKKTLVASEIKPEDERIHPDHIFDGPTIFYHEDDFRQVEILPNDNLKILQAESQEVSDFGDEYFDGYGFTDIYVRSDENKIPLSQRQINPVELEKILISLGLKRVPNVLTGYGQTYRELRLNCVAFGEDYKAIYYDFKDNIVQNIWLTNHRSMDEEKLAKCLYELGKQWDLLLQDWNRKATIDLNNRESIDGYLS